LKSVALTILVPLAFIAQKLGGNTQENHRVLGVKPVEKSSKKLAANLVQFQFVMPVIIKDLFMFTASNNH